LETTVEIGREYLEIFEENGGQTLDLVPSLNSEDFLGKRIGGNDSEEINSIK